MRELIALGLLAGGLFYVIVNLSLSVSTNVSALAIAGQMGAPFALILAVIFLGERIARYRIAGMILAFLGVMTLVFDPHAFDERLGLALTVLGSLVWAICSLIQRRLNGIPVLTIYAWVGVMGTLSLLPVALLVEPQAMALGGVFRAWFDRHRPGNDELAVAAPFGQFGRPADSAQPGGCCTCFVAMVPYQADPAYDDGRRDGDDRHCYRDDPHRPGQRIGS
jgi:predicted membrane protein